MDESIYKDEPWYIKMNELICHVCGRKFKLCQERKTNDLDMCSAECRDNYLKNRLNTKCIKCGNEFTAQFYKIDTVCKKCINS